MPGLMINSNKSTEILIEGKYNHGNDIKELVAVVPLSINNSSGTTNSGAAGEVDQKSSHISSSCSSISISGGSAADVDQSSSSSSGKSSTANILSAGGGGGGKEATSGGVWTKMQQRFTWQYALDLFMVLGFFVIFALIETNVIPVFKRGFFCDDRTIIYKFTGDTVSIVTLLIVTLPAQFFVIWIIEYFSTNDVSEKEVGKAIFYRSLRIYKDYLMGQIICLGVVSVMKTCYGGLRPHFLDTCRPDSLLTCSPGEFVTNYRCTNQEVSNFNMLDSRKSFPSGHSSMSVFQALFTIWFMQMRLNRFKTNLTILIVQFIFLSWGIYCSISRATDYRHHWWDVLFGACLGVIFAILTCKIVCKNFLAGESSSCPRPPTIRVNSVPRVNYGNGNNRLLGEPDNHSSTRSEV